MLNISKPLSGCLEWPCATREIDTAGWLFEKTNSHTNLLIVPILAISVFFMLVVVKVHRWYTESVKQKTRGDVEFGDESEVNYGIIREGDKEFCKVEMRSDTTSVYDTVTSFRLFGNGQPTCIVNDTVGSYKSLVLQRGDPSHYDSVKSYKAFLKQVTQNRDLDVEVKLLENYPMKCKSAEHCVVMEEDCSASWHISKSKLLQDSVKAFSNDKKKNRYRRASGDPLGPMRKRSASNPIYSCRQTGATSLPSIHYSVSSDSSNEEDSISAFRMQRKKAFEDRCSKKISRSCSGGRLTKVSCSDKTLEEDQELLNNPKRKRHYSADGGSRMGKLAIGNKHFKISRAFQHELNNLRESISETDPKPEEHVLVAPDESSSENPDSSPSPCDSSVSSDAIESESDDDDTKLVTQISAISDCTTVISNHDLASSAEILSSHSDDFTFSDPGNSLSSSQHVSNEKYINSCQTDSQNTNGHANSSTLDTDTISNNHQTDTHQCSSLENLSDESSSIVNNNVPLVAAKTAMPYQPDSLHNRSSSSPTVYGKLLAEREDSEDTDNSVASNPRRVKRFHVTSVQKDDLATHRSSSGCSLLDS